MTHTAAQPESFNRSWDHALIWSWLALAVMLAGEKGVDLGAGLVLAGAAYLLAGLLWAGRVTVAPMLTIAAAALVMPRDRIAPGLEPTVIAASGAAAGAMLALGGATRVGGLIVTVIGRGPIDGLRLALGLWLAGRGVKWVLQTNLPYGPDSWLTAGVVALGLVAGWRLTRRWVLTIALAIGAALAWWKDPYVSGHVALGWSLPRWAPPAWDQVQATLWPLAIPAALLAMADITAPLRLARQVRGIDVSSNDESPRAAAAPTDSERDRLLGLPSRWLLAVVGGVVALAAGCVGAAPVHLLDSERGRRLLAPTIERAAALIVGLLLIIVGVVLAPSLMPWCAAMPGSVVGVLAAIIGVHLALPALLETTWRTSVIALLTAAVALTTGHLGWALLLGWALSLVIGRGRERGPAAASAERR